jgi:hypothetical protein
MFVVSYSLDVSRTYWDAAVTKRKMRSSRDLLEGKYRLLQGTGKFMRHVKLRPGTATNAAALSRLIDTAYSDIKARVENG